MYYPALIPMVPVHWYQSLNYTITETSTVVFLLPIYVKNITLMVFKVVRGTVTRIVLAR